jgi:UDP-2,4-diacetamido-2,4,6-trideoxy-beta-L-altropyranose hydrolase
MRCVTLADELRAAGAKVVFACRDLTGDAPNVLDEKGFPTRKLPESSSDDAADTAGFVRQIFGQADWVIVDNYKLDREWETQVSLSCKRMMVIDDIADRRHECALLLDQNLYHDSETRYDGLVPNGCRKLLGPEYALLRGEFLQVRQALRERDGVVRNILISFGGSDHTGQTVKALEAWRRSGVSTAQIDVVIGPLNSRRQEIERLYGFLPNVRLHGQSRNMAALMAEADLAIGGAGTTAWERFCVGLPSIVISVASNQVETARAAGDKGLHLYLGHDTDVSIQSLSDALSALAAAPNHLLKMSELGRAAVDGNGVRRVVAALN